MGRLIDITGQRFGRLTVLGRGKPQRFVRNQSRHAYWRCRCDCGEETVASSDNLRRGCIVSCGCWRAETSGRRMRAAWAALRNAAGTPVPGPGQASSGTGLASSQETGPAGA